MVAVCAGQADWSLNGSEGSAAFELFLYYSVDGANSLGSEIYEFQTVIASRCRRLGAILDGSYASDCYVNRHPCTAGLKRRKKHYQRV